ncbi:MAG TPA: type II toxin-antitoxin system VapC family toxin [Longimicrobiales bacterium]|nr:type II toxin-antitoxin system VapC family toxin [Longimicrobiales bacterium]
MTADVWLAGERPNWSGPALLDTHVWIWHLQGETRGMSGEASELVRRCVREDGVWVSDISVWEVGMQASRGRLELMPSVSAWVESASRRPGFSFMLLDRQVLLGSTQLPGDPHGDPADRMLIASAAISGRPLFTADERIIEYARRQGGFSVCDVRS